MLVELTSPQRIDFLARLRTARTLVLEDAEAFHQAAGVLEHIGQILNIKPGNGLGSYTRVLVDLAAKSSENRDAVKRLFDIVKEARNKAVHDGAYIRHHSSRLVDFILLLEQSITSQMNTVEELMVRGPIVAESWQYISHLRTVLLSNSFSYLPYWCDTQMEWLLISDASIVNFLARDWEGSIENSARGKRKEKERMTIKDAVEEKLLSVSKAELLSPDDSIDEIKLKINDSKPRLVLEELGGEKRLVGIISPFDLL